MRIPSRGLRAEGAVFLVTFTTTGKTTQLFKLRIPLVLLLIVLLGGAATGWAQEAQSFSVQVGAFTERANAEEMAAALVRQGYTPYLFETTDGKGRRWWLVRIGDYPSVEEAREAAGRYEAARKQPAVITPRGSRVAVRPPPEETPAHGPSGQGPAALETEENPDLKRLEEQVERLQTEVEALRKQAEARKRLEVTDEEKAKQEKEILTAAGRQYTLLPQYTLGVEYDFRYEYYSYDVLEQAMTVEQIANHTIVNGLYVEFALLNNLTLNLDCPFVYKFDKSGTDHGRDVTDLGDVTLGLKYQPLKTGGRLPALVAFGTFTFDTGRGQYEVNPETELATGNGYETAGLGLSMSKTIDPIVAFGTISYSFAFSADDLNQRRPGDVVLKKVEPGDSIGFNLGIGYAMSYKVSLNFSYQYVYHFKDKYHWEDSGETTAGSRVFSVLSIGTGWQLSPTFSMIMRVGVGLTNDDPDFTFSVRMPFQFNLG